MGRERVTACEEVFELASARPLPTFSLRLVPVAESAVEPACPRAYELLIVVRMGIGRPVHLEPVGPSARLPGARRLLPLTAESVLE